MYIYEIERSSEVTQTNKAKKWTTFRFAIRSIRFTYKKYFFFVFTFFFDLSLFSNTQIKLNRIKNQTLNTANE